MAKVDWVQRRADSANTRPAAALGSIGAAPIHSRTAIPVWASATHTDQRHEAASRATALQARASPSVPCPSVILHPKLAVGSVNDPLEHEADRVAEQVMHMPGTDLSVIGAPAQVSRKCAACEEEDEKTLQTKATPFPGEVGAAPPLVHDVLRSRGEPLGPQERAFFEPRFRKDFGRVQVHDDPQAARSAGCVGAAAYTVGTHIVFGSGRFSPGTEPGKLLLAHELTHVVQQAAAVPALMRTPLLSSAMQVCKRILVGEHVFHVSEGGIIVTADASWGPSEEWQGEERPECGKNEYHITLKFSQ